MRRGFSLLEVILALAILAGSMAVLGQLIQLGMTHAQQAEDMTKAAIACESIMAEIVSGVRTPTDVLLASYGETGDSGLLYSVVTKESSSLQAGMIEVHVIVELDPSTSVQPVQCVLVRWVVDPDYVASLSETTTN